MKRKMVFSFIAASSLLGLTRLIYHQYTDANAISAILGWLDKTPTTK